jgi:hypothetical protein
MQYSSIVRIALAMATCACASNASAEFIYRAGSSEPVAVTDLPGGPWVEPEVISDPGASANQVRADFENFTEGDFFYPSFRDPRSRIFFTDSTGPDPGEWVIEYAESRPGLPTTTPGNFLSSVGYSPGPGLGLPYQFGLTGILPFGSPSLSVTMLYSVYPQGGGTPTVTLQGFGDGGMPLSSTTFTTTTGDFVEKTLTISSSIDILSFKITPRYIFTGFDNITFSPEPSCGAAMMLVIVLQARRYRQRPRRAITR